MGYLLGSFNILFRSKYTGVTKGYIFTKFSNKTCF